MRWIWMLGFSVLLVSLEAGFFRRVLIRPPHLGSMRPFVRRAADPR
jgi:hypothetical protein